MSEIQILDVKGKLLPLENIEAQVANADDATRERFVKFKAVVEASAAADAAVEAARASLATATKQLDSANQYLKIHFPPQSSEAGRIAEVKRIIADNAARRAAARQ